MSTPRLPSSISEVLSPSDLTKAPGVTFFVGGRVVAREVTRVVLADAFAAISLEFDGPVDESLAPGALVVLRVERSGGGKFRVLEVPFLDPRDEPRAKSEFGRFSLSGAGRTLRARNELLALVREYFASERFVETTTPAFTECPGLDENVDSLGTVSIGGAPLHLITSPEFHLKRMLVGGFPRIFEVAAAHRGGELGTRHEPVFTLIEWYRAFASYEKILEDTENIVRRAATLASDGRLHVALAGPERTFPTDAPFERITVREAFSRFAGIADVRELLLSSRDRYFETLVEVVEPALAKIPRPVFLLDYPIELGALAQPREDDENYAERFELYVGGVELSNGYGELTNAKVQRARFERELSRRAAADSPVYPLPESFLDALDEGMPPASGNALGLERLLMVTLGLSNIGDTIAFPRSNARG